MLDIKFVREQADAVIQNASFRGVENAQQLVDAVLEADTTYRSALAEEQKLRSQRNTLSKQISEAKKAGQDPADLFKQAKELPGKITEAEDVRKKQFSQLQDKLVLLPNIVHSSVPQGVSESENVETFRSEGNFSPKDLPFHGELLDKMHLLDFGAGARTSGKGFYFMKGDLALLNQALLQFAVQTLAQKGFTFVEPPLMISQRVLEGVYSKVDIEQQVFTTSGNDLNLIATSEHPLIGMFMDKQVLHKQLPVKIVGYSPCFRREVGAHGLDERGLFRTHQFHKVEQVALCHPDESWQLFDELLENSSELLRLLGIPFRHLEMCTGDLGFMKARQIDVEVYSPRQDAFFEVCSCSNLTDNQSMLLNIRVAHHDGNYYPHTLNNTAIATSRVLIAIVEHYMQDDGSIVVPEVLRPFMMGKDKLSGLDNWFV